MLKKIYARIFNKPLKFLIVTGEVKVDLANFDLKLRKNFLNTYFFKLPIRAEKFWILFS
jgi:hypothetical protein